MEGPGRIVADRKICGGKPTIRGTRIMVWNIIGMFAGGATMDDILKDYPNLTREDIVASLEYVMDLLDEDTLVFRDWSEIGEKVCGEKVCEEALPGSETIVRNNSIRVFMGPRPE